MTETKTVHKGEFRTLVSCLIDAAKIEARMFHICDTHDEEYVEACQQVERFRNAIQDAYATEYHKSWNVDAIGIAYPKE